MKLENRENKSNILEGKKALFHTLGCKLNFAETSTLSDSLLKKGVVLSDKGEPADICIVNTCSVTDVADQKCRQVIHRLTRDNPDALIVVLGCYAQLQPDKIASFPGVDLVIGMEQKGDTIRYIEEGLAQRLSLEQGENVHAYFTVPTKEIQTFVPSCSRGNRTRYFIKVQDGCNYHCTYCTIPFARGKSRNGTIQSLVEQAQSVAEDGGKEIVITGVNIGDFGRSTGENFFDLLKALDKVDGIERYRISSIEPNLLTDEIIEFCANSRAFMPHFHVPLQSGSDAVLKLMKRRYDTALFRRKMEKIKEVMPDAFIGVDVIVGTRGETEDYFEEAYQFIKSLDISQLHVFSYSERPGTKALEIPHIVSQEEKHARSQRLLSLSEEKRKDFYRKFIGEKRAVLWEHAKEGHALRGFTDNYIRVELDKQDNTLNNTLGTVCLGNFNSDEQALCATIVEKVYG